MTHALLQPPAVRKLVALLRPLPVRKRTTILARVIHLTPDNAQATYFRDRQDSLKAPVLEQLIAAIV